MDTNITVILLYLNYVSVCVVGLILLWIGNGIRRELEDIHDHLLDGIDKLPER